MPLTRDALLEQNRRLRSALGELVAPEDVEEDESDLDADDDDSENDE